MQMIAGVMPLIGGLLSAGGQLSQGDEIKQESYFEAAQLNANAKKAMAASTVDAENTGREWDFLMSKSMAIAGSSGGGLDPQIANLIANMAGEKRLAIDRALYAGEEKSQTLNLAAGAKRFSGSEAKKASRVSALGTVLSSAGQGAVNWFGAGKFVRTSTGALV